MAGPRLFAPDPIDIYDPTPYAALAYYSHMAIGLAAFAALATALWGYKGGRIHKRAGQIYLIAVGAVAASATAMLAVAFVPPLMLATVTVFYASIGAWLAWKPAKTWVVATEIGLAIAELIALGVFLSFAIAGVRAGLVPAPAIAVLCLIPVILLVGDVRFFIANKERRRLRLARHLSRMIWSAVVLVRAPLVEVVAAGLPIPGFLLVIGPIVVGFAMILYFRRKYKVRAPWLI